MNTNRITPEIEYIRETIFRFGEVLYRLALVPPKVYRSGGSFKEYLLIKYYKEKENR